MKRFACPHCSNEVYFDSATCVGCQSRLGYVASGNRFLSSPDDAQGWILEGQDLSRCGNFQMIGCNWLVEPDGASNLCRSCRHTLTIPDLTVEGNTLRWSRLEAAKRALFYSIDRFGLSAEAAPADAGPSLRFDFKADEVTATGVSQPILTGHERGLITLNIAESDDAEREKRRTGMGEPYRTLIGHFRHETGHYFWDQLVDRSPFLEDFRRIFGDERQDYAQSLENHYRNGAQANWSLNYVSAYATSHPWEDFAETWAHVFHMVDGLETAEAYGIAGNGQATGPAQPGEVSPYAVVSMSDLVSEWVPVTVAMNAMNRSIGQPDFYPFVLSEAIGEKLQFILNIIHAKTAPAAGPGN